jgi:hypothetical protein
MNTTEREAEVLCSCKDRTLSACSGEWGPGCDLGNNSAHVRVCQQRLEEREATTRKLGFQGDGEHG